MEPNAYAPKKRTYWPWIVGGLLLLIIALVIIRRTRDDVGLEVTTEPTERRDIYAQVTESGTIQPTVEVPLAPDVSGEVVELYVQEGMKVKRGDLLLTIRPDNYRAALEQARASLNLARANREQALAAVQQARATYLQDSVSLRRTRELFQQNVVSQLDLETATLRANLSQSQLDGARYSARAAYYQIQNADATLSQARQNLDRTNIYASMDGTLTLLNVELGQRVVGTMQMAGTELLRIADLSRMEVVSEVSENDIVDIQLGDSARIEVDAYPGKYFFGKVSEIAYSANQNMMGSTDQVTNFEVKVQINPSSYAPERIGQEIPSGGSPFRPGMSAFVEMFTDRAEGALTVPIQAVTLAPEDEADKDKADRDEPLEVVYVVEGDLARMQTVETGISDDRYIVIKSGLREEQEVVTGPYSVLARQLRDSTRVRVKASE